MSRLDAIQGIMFDLDGTLILSDRQLGGYQLLPGAAELLTELERRAIPFVAMTNGSAYPAAVQASRLRSIGLPIADDRLFTPNSVAVEMFRSDGVEQVMVLGTEQVAQVLADGGIDVVTPGDDPAQAVYVAWHPGCTMEHIHFACDAVLGGARLFTASDVPFFATKSGRAFGYSCAIVGAITRVTGCDVTVTGKPSMAALDFVARHLGCPRERIAVVGDDPRVEMEMAIAGGALGIGVTTGTTSRQEWAQTPPSRKPLLLIDSLDELNPLMFGNAPLRASG